MNPEFQKNLWLDLSPMRVITMPLFLALAFVAIWTTTGLVPGDDTQWLALSGAARRIFFFIVVMWGSWISARLVTGEIRDRTWDAQRMSAIGPWTMVWGKLLGGTTFVWYGGVIALVPILIYEFDRSLDAAIENLLFYVSMGLFAHATAFFISMLAVTRKAATSRLATFFAFTAGITAAWWIEAVWFGSDLAAQGSITWFYMEFNFYNFLLTVLGLQVAWVLIGSYVLMRKELQVKTGPWAWIAFVIYSMVLFAGQAELLGFMGSLGGTIESIAKATAGLISVEGIPGDAMILVRWMIASMVAVVLTYAAIFVTPKDWVQLRWIKSQFNAGRLLSALSNLPSWAYSFIALFVAAAFAISMMEVVAVTSPIDLGVLFNLGSNLIPDTIDPRPMVIAGILFLARDIGIVLWFNAGKSAKRPDLAAFMVLVGLYVLIPLILVGMKLWNLLPLVSPMTFSHGWLHPLWPALQVAIVFALIIVRRRMVRSKG